MLGEYLVSFNDKMYVVVRTIKVNNNPIIETWKEHLHCDTVLKKDGYYYFCRVVTDVIDEESENNISE